MFPITLEICKRMTSYIEQEIKLPSENGMDAKDVSNATIFKVWKIISKVGCHSGGFSNLHMLLVTSMELGCEITRTFVANSGNVLNFSKLKRDFIPSPI